MMNKLGQNKEDATAINMNAVRQLIEKQKKENKESETKILLGIEGDAKTGKSGLCMDSNLKTFYLDVDIGAVPTWKTNHNSTDRIMILNPEIKNEQNETLPYKTQGMIRSFIALAQEAIDNGEEVLFVWDGVDTWLDYCTLYMTGMENSRMRPMKVDKQQDWYQRNQPFREVLKEAISLNCHRVFITHTKPPFRDEPPQPIWNRLDSQLHSILQTYVRFSPKGTEYVVRVKSSKFHPELVGDTSVFLTIGNDKKVTWNGFKPLKEFSI